MTHRRTLAGLAVLALGAGGAGTAVAAKQAAAPASVTVKSIASGTFKPNRYIQDGARYDRDVYTIRSGGLLTFRDATKGGEEGPHTLSVVKRSQVPNTFGKLQQCFANKGVCGKLNNEHGATDKGIKNPLLNTGKPGLDGAGDSAFIAPNGNPHSSVKLKVSAKAGSKLYFFCLVHPWMQARIDVK